MRFWPRRSRMRAHDSGAIPPPSLADAAVASSPLTVTPQGAATSTIAVYACVRVVAETLASAPFMLYRRRDVRTRDRIDEREPGRDGRLARLLHTSPNPELTPMQVWETLLGHALLWGNGYAEIETDRMGVPVALWPLRPDRMTVELKVVGRRRERVYTYAFDPKTLVTFRPGQILHLAALSLDGLVGVSPIRVARYAVATEQTAHEYAAGLWQQGGMKKGALIFPQKLKPEERERARIEWQELNHGVRNVHRIGVLSGGVTWQEIGMPPEDAQFLQTRTFELREIARLYRIQPHKIGDLERATFSNIEHQAIEWVVDTILPWAERLEQAVNRDLGNPPFETLTDLGLQAEFNLDGLLRGDIATRYAAYAVGRAWGWLSADDVRAKENLAPIPGGTGEGYLQPANYIPLGSEPPPGMAGPGDDALRSALALLSAARVPEPAPNGSGPHE